VGNEDSVFEVVHRRASSDLSYFGLLEYVRFEFVSAECMKRAIEFISDSFEGFTFGMWLSLRTRLTLSVTPPLREHRFVWPPAIDSTIISSIPDIFSVFRDKIFCLLYRGSRDGFEPSAFHGRCNGHSNTVTLILSTNDCIFGGFTPIAWSSRNSYASDPSLNSFLFTIKNLHNLPPQIFKQQRADKAIYDHETCGPAFGSHRDLVICDQKTSSDGTFSHLGSGYTNDTGIGGSQVLTGARKFSLKEIAVFEVI
jgi:hypothetical protein